MPTFSEACKAFVDGIQHPNEQTLAKEILVGKKVGDFSLNFDQGQVDAMTARLEGAGCFQKEEAVEEAPVAEATDEAPAGAGDEVAGEDKPEAVTAPEAPVEGAEVTGEAKPEAPAEGAGVPAEAPVGEVAIAPAEGAETAKPAGEGEGQA